MRSLKDTKFFTEVVSLLDQPSTSGQILFHLFSQFKPVSFPQDIQSIYYRTGIIKLFILLKLLSVKSIHACIRLEWERLLPLSKDVLYKVRNSPLIPWRRLLRKQAFECLSYASMPESEVYRPCKHSTKYR